ncbi:4'-phosphopantetheinyl transferase [Russula earlei]|uniref:4'-phosphopantetheinyl transferase n=1 Tax=Russula earlei TaxID=71964 RepID=A0ACC0UHC0_9AGAM|nr:4'-phosphopantetheinyl transferase [Russula earlei]
MLGIGVDILHLPRLARHLSDNRLAKRILSPAELREYLSLPEEDRGRRIRFLGVRWAVKEAVYKAVCPTLKPTWKDFTLRQCARSPKPDLVYHPKDDLLSLRLGQIHTSASHDGDYVFATVIVERPALA